MMGNETWIMKKTFICKQASKQRGFFLFFSTSVTKRRTDR